MVLAGSLSTKIMFRWCVASRVTLVAAVLSVLGLAAVVLLLPAFSPSDAPQSATPGRRLTGPRHNVRQITLTGFPEKVDGKERSFLNGEFHLEDDSKHVVDDRETYWTEDNLYYIFYCRAADQWRVGTSWSWPQNKMGACRGYARTASGAELLDGGEVRFVRIWSGSEWVPTSGNAGIITCDRTGTGEAHA